VYGADVGERNDGHRFPLIPGSARESQDTDNVDGPDSAGTLE